MSFVTQAARFKTYVRPIVSDGVNNTVLAVPNPFRTAVGFYFGNAALVTYSFGTYDENTGPIQASPNTLYWFHFEKYQTLVQLELVAFTKVPGINYMVYEVLSP